MPADFLSLVRERVAVLDGAMGTNIHRYDPTDADWGGKELMNVCDAVALTHPEWVRAIHTSFLTNNSRDNLFNAPQKGGLIVPRR